MTGDEDWGTGPPFGEDGAQEPRRSVGQRRTRQPIRWISGSVREMDGQRTTGGGPLVSRTATARILRRASGTGKRRSSLGASVVGGSRTCRRTATIAVKRAGSAASPTRMATAATTVAPTCTAAIVGVTTATPWCPRAVTSSIVVKERWATSWPTASSARVVHQPAGRRSVELTTPPRTAQAATITSSDELPGSGPPATPCAATPVVADSAPTAQPRNRWTVSTAGLTAAS